MPELARLQAHFAAGLLDPGAATPDLFSGDPLRAARCFGLYRGNLAANWDKSLGAAFPVVRQLVGNDFFRAMAREFGRAKPSTSGDLNRFGEGFADFLSTFAPLSGYPYMPDVARLEWLLHRAHYAADSTPLDPLSLASMGAGTVESLQLGLREGHYLFHSPWDVVGVWLAHQPGAEAGTNSVDRPARCVVRRPNWRAELLCISQGEFIALQSIDGGATLGEALESALAADPDFDPGTSFPRWLEAGIFAPHNPRNKSKEIENEPATKATRTLYPL